MDIDHEEQERQRKQAREARRSQLTTKAPPKESPKQSPILQQSPKESSTSQPSPPTQTIRKDLFSLFKPAKYSKELVTQPKREETRKIAYYTEEPDIGTKCVKYYYPNKTDFETKNLPCKRRPWQPEGPDGPVGREAYDNAINYRPGYIHDYVDKWYVKYFTNRGIESPFSYTNSNIHKTAAEVCGSGDDSDFSLQPHQKFIGSHMSNLTDFGSMLLFHRLGSGKTASSIIIAESNKGVYNDSSKNYVTNQNRLVPQRRIISDKEGHFKEGDFGAEPKPCHITVVVPKQTMNQYIDELRGNVENGILRACSSACVIYSEDPSENPDGEDGYTYMRQLYVGEIDEKTRKPKSTQLEELRETERKIVELKTEWVNLNNKDNKTMDDIESQNNINTAISQLENKHKFLIKKMDASIKNVYYIVSHQRFLNSITNPKNNQQKGSGNIEYEPSLYLLGKEHNKKLPHPDCFHSKKSVLIIDEIQKMTSEGGTNYTRLYNTLMFYARDNLTGEARMKVILLTATPIYDNPHEASLMINLQRPRILFPLDRLTFDNFFIDRDDKDNVFMKNKLCYKYLISGYVSFSEGANPKGFPLRRNIIKLHPMESIQENNYITALCYDVQQDANDESKYANVQKSDLFNKIYKLQPDDNHQGRYLMSRQRCNIAFPKKNKLTDREDNDASSNEVNEMIQTLLLEGKKGKTKEQSDKYIMDTYKKYSSKFHGILQSIKNSDREGPIIVYCEWVYYGILAMTKVLELLGWKFLNLKDVSETAKQIKQKNKNTNTFAIWSSTALTGMNINNLEMNTYTSNLRNLINSKENKHGKVCKVLFTTVTEGVSLKRVSQIHITNPWWNESRTEQAIGRGIRFCSHSDLPIEKQYVDVYYHCSVLRNFKNFPEVDEQIASKLADAIHGNKKGKHTARVNYKNLAVLSIEQKVFITSRRKNDINTQFERAIKETAIDNELNKYGNLIRFEEVVNKDLKVDGRPYIGKIFYNRCDNIYYNYKKDSSGVDELYRLNIDKKNVAENIPVWPILTATTAKKVDLQKEWKDQYEIIQIGEDGLVSFIVNENIKSFNNDPNVRDKNFKELMSYAVNEKNEEQNVWRYFEDNRIKKELFEIFNNVYGLADGKGTTQLFNTFNERILSGRDADKLLHGTAGKDLAKELRTIAEKNNDMKLVHTIDRNINKIPDIPINSITANRNKKRLNYLFYKENRKNIDEMTKHLIKQGLSAEEVESLGISGIEREYIERI